MRLLVCLLTIAGVSAVAGCGDSPPTVPAAQSVAARPAPAASPNERIAQEPSAEQRAVAAVAQGFLRAVLTGDSRTALGLLTAPAAARQGADPAALAALGMPYQGLEVAEVRMLGPGEAAAACLITEQVGGAPAEICCLLKRETAGWRVAGVATEADGQGPAVISFEDAPEPDSPTENLVEGVDGGSDSARTAAEGGKATLR